MIAFLLAVLLGAELLRRLPVLATFRRLAAISARTGTVLRRRGVSDYSKERALQILSRRMFFTSLLACALLCLVLAPIALALALDHWGIAPVGALRVLTDWRDRLVILGICLSYAIIRWQWRRLRPAR